MKNLLRLLYITASNEDALRVEDAFREAGQAAEILQVKTPDRLADALHDGPWDAAIADYAAPGFKAPAGLAQIASAEPDLPYIVLSDPIGEKAVAAIFKAGASDYVRRDDLKRLLPAVKRQVHRAHVRKKRREDEEEFEQSERKYRTLFDCASDSMFITDFTGKILDANRTACVRLGYTRLELLRKKIVDIDPEEPPAETAERMERLKRLGSRVFERVYVTKQGVRFPVEVNTRIFEFGGEKAILSIVRDLSDRKRAAEALRISETKLSDAMKMAHMGHWEYDVAADRFTFNDNFYAIFRTTAAAAGGYVMSAAEYSRRFIHPADVGVVERETRKAIETSDPYFSRSLEHRMLYADGEEGYIAVRFFIVKDETGRTVKTYGVNQDVTEWRRAEEAVRESDERFRRIFQYSAAGTVIVGTDFRFKRVNEAFCRMLGFSEEELLARTFQDVTYPDDRPLGESLVREMLSGSREAFQLEKRYVRRDGAVVWGLVSSTLIRHAAGLPGYFVTQIQDITERRLMEESLQWELQVNSALADLYTPLVSPDAALPEVMRAMLDRTLQLTGSSAGLVTLVDPQTGECEHYASGRTMFDVSRSEASSETRSESRSEREARSFERASSEKGAGAPAAFARSADGTYPGLLGYALTTRTAFFTNDPSRHPAFSGWIKDHQPVDRFLSAPLLLGKELVGQIALGNPGRDYTERDLDAIRRMAGTFALAVQSKRAEEQVKASLQEKILLLKEIHHRIKNNLQVVMSLLNLQSYHVTDARAQALFRENQLRIRSMALVHERLYQSHDLSHVDFRDYIAKLAVDLYRAYRVDADTVRFSVKVDDIALGVDASVPCGLIINELLLNSLKHAFPRGRKGSITVTLERFVADQLLLTVADDGVGLGKNVDLYGSKSLGFSLVVALTEQLGGSIQVSREPGTKIEILFKTKD